MAFEVYTPRRRGTRSAKVRKPAIRLSKMSLVLNKQAREIINSDTVELAFDPETGMIRIAPGGDIQVKKTKIFVRGFCKQFGITARGKFDVEEEDGALLAKIS
jgi:hypothetical protein